MGRDEMLKILNTHPVAAEFVVLPSEAAIECTYVCEKGFKYQWIAFEAMPAYTVKFASSDCFCNLAEKINNRCLCSEDICDTVLGAIYAELFDNTGDLNRIFSDLGNITLPEDQRIYMLRTSNGTRFYSDYKSFEDGLLAEYLSDCTPWDSLSDNELEEWTERLECEFNEIPCFEYEE